MLQVGLNPYGLTYHLGLQGHGTPRANPHGRGLDGFIAIAQELGARVIELHNPWLAAMSDAELLSLRARLADLQLIPIIGSGLPYDPPEAALRSAAALGAKTVRVNLTRVLCGDRGALGDQWPALVADVRRALATFAAMAERAGVTLAIENHQDFTSSELLALCEEAGKCVGICYDTGNSFPVGEAPLDFTRRVAARVRHVHLKDYRAQWTDEGFRLVRCAIGDGAVPFKQIVRDPRRAPRQPHGLAGAGRAGIPPRAAADAGVVGAYAPVSATALAACLEAARHRRLREDEDARTPWERGDDGAVADYELAMIRRSAANMRAIGVMI